MLNGRDILRAKNRFLCYVFLIMLPSKVAVVLYRVTVISVKFLGLFF